MSLPADHWGQLSVPVHPLDAPVLAASAHTFNLDFPHWPSTPKGAEVDFGEDRDAGEGLS